MLDLALVKTLVKTLKVKTDRVKDLTQENATLKQQLADASAKDVADESTIAELKQQAADAKTAADIAAADAAKQGEALTLVQKQLEDSRAAEVADEAKIAELEAAGNEVNGQLKEALATFGEDVSADAPPTEEPAVAAG